MDLSSTDAIKELMAKYQAAPSKLMGQNFLIDKHVLANIIKAAEITKTDTILEVGPGIGTLTQELSKAAKNVISIEKDYAMVEILKETLADVTNVEVIQGNALTYENYPLPEHYKIVANIPYYLTSPIIRKFLEEKHQPKDIVLMVQKEVAQRICATVPNMSILSVSIQFYATPKIITYVSKECFWPKPTIDSAILKITPLQDKHDVPTDDFFKVVKAGFMWPRKQLGGNLANVLKRDKKIVSDWLLQQNIDPKRRAETLTIQDWLNLTHSL